MHRALYSSRPPCASLPRTLATRQRARSHRSFRQLDRRLLVARAIKNRDLPDASRNFGVRRGRELLREIVAFLAVVDLESHFDQLVREQRFFRLSDDGVAHAAFADANDRRKRMRESFEELALLR